jgi:hypothetical protein
MNGGWVERKNLAGDKEYAGIRKTLESRLTRWWQWVVDPVELGRRSHS